MNLRVPSGLVKAGNFSREASSTMTSCQGRTSRSGATIAGGLLLKTDKRSAAEFSFFLALPTMGAAVVYDLLKNWDRLDFTDAGLIVVGFLTAFLTALLVVRMLLDFVSRHGFAPFAWWRIVVGIVGIVGLAATGAL